MSREFQVFIGINITFGPKPVTFIALDPDQQPMAIGDGDVPDALAYCAGQRAGALVAVNFAACHNRGRMKRAEVRKSLTPLPPKGKFTALRQVEYEIIQAGMEIPETPASPDTSLPWVRRRFTLVEKLETLGYRPFAEDSITQTEAAAETADLPADSPAPRLWLETNADAGFWSLLGVRPLEAGTLEGRIQRQLVLKDEELEVPDAMDFFEEITRFKILKSNLPTKNIFPQVEINAWMAAHTAWLAANQPERVKPYGEPEEGFIFLPIKAG